MKKTINLLMLLLILNSSNLETSEYKFNNSVNKSVQEIAHKPKKGIDVLIETNYTSDNFPQRITTIKINPEFYQLNVMTENEMNKKYINITDVLNNTDAIATINGGFYESDFSPSGLVIKDYIKLSPTNSTAGSGVLTIDSENKISIDPIKNLQIDKHIKSALQCGPLLVYNNENLLKGKKLKDSSYYNVDRTVIAIDSENNIYLTMIEKINLADLATLMQTKYAFALNLDGGPSCNIGVKGEEYFPAKETKNINYIIALEK